MPFILQPTPELCGRKSRNLAPGEVTTMYAESSEAEGKERTNSLAVIDKGSEPVRIKDK